MNIETTNVKKTNETITTTSNKQLESNDSNVKFADELKDLENQNNEKIEEETELKEDSTHDDSQNNDLSVSVNDNSAYVNKIEKNTDKQVVFDNAIEGLNNIVIELNQSEDKNDDVIKNQDDLSDNKGMINNDLNIQENKDLLPQMSPNMNFSGDGQPFSSFMNNEQTNSKETLKISEKDLEEESKILSTMAENIAIANKNNILKNQNVENVPKEKQVNVLPDIEQNIPLQPETKIVNRNEGVKKVESSTGITVETIVKFDNIIMNQADVEVFTGIVENNQIDINNLAPKAVEKGVQVSKTLADMLAQAMEKNQPVRIDFDNDISIIIRISRDGKISADFLPSSQIAEAYLKENLPILRQKFESNNIEYESLEQKERKDQNREQNKKKGRENE